MQDMTQRYPEGLEDFYSEDDINIIETESGKPISEVSDEDCKLILECYELRSNHEI